VLVLAAATAQAREVDQFTDRLFQLDHLHDASAVLDARVDAMLRDLAAELTARHATRDDRERLVRDAFIGSRLDFVGQLHSPYESWVRDDAAVELYRADARGIYGALDYDDVGLAWYIENAPVVRLGSRLVGIDKLGHFFGQGWFYYVRWQTTHDDDDVRRYGHEQEASYLGTTGTGIYSYADLAANWRGLQFYRALFDGPDPYVAADGGTYRVRRAFHWADYASDAWDEVQNPSRPRSERAYEAIAGYLRTHACAAYHRDPVRFANATGRTQDPHDYVWSGAELGRRLELATICR
jgi:hypothetical protein